MRNDGENPGTPVSRETLTQKTLKLLEFDVIRERLASRAMSDEAAALIRGESPETNPETLKKTKNAVRTIITRIREAGDPRLYLPAIGFLLPKLETEGAVLEADEIHAIGLFAERGGEIRKWLPPDFFPVTVGEIPDCSEIAVRVFRVMDRDGNIRDLPELRAIRQKIRSLQSGLDAAISRYTSGDDIRRMLQSTVPSQRDGRIVLAVRANFQARIRGIVHDVSSGGQTVFIEPEDVVEKNNALFIENKNLEAEIRKIMAAVTSYIASRADDLKNFHAAAVKVEALTAKARYSEDMAGNFSPDEDRAPGENRRRLKLVQARHPLLKNPVPIDLIMDGDTQALIITGPNTGGKTVALKTVGIFSLMNQTGLALPAAEGTVLPVFDGTFADIGDEQSIGQSLSTFSAHITNVAGIIEHSSGDSLVLLDELGSGTDPQEGSAIAMAVLDTLIVKKTRLLITTHHGILKNYGYTRREVENASVEFDTRTLSPTYRIITGVPGESRALEIAARNGMPAAIVSGARNYLDAGHSDVSALISGLKDKHRDLDALAEKNRQEESRLKDERLQSDLKELRLRQKEAEIKAGFTGNLRLLLDESRKTLENLVREVREGEMTREKTLKVKEFLGELSRTVEAENAALEKEEAEIAGKRRLAEGKPAAGNATDFFPGRQVLVGEAKRRGVLVRPDRKTAAGMTWIVEIGSLKISFPERDLVPADRASLRRGSRSASVELAGSFSARLEINLIGMRLLEALETLRRQTDAAILQGLKEFSVIHGTGSGILQKGVHDWLKRENCVADYFFSRPELGGFGRTEVILK